MKAQKVPLLGRLEFIKELRHKGYTLQYIGLKLGVSRQRIHQMISPNEIKRMKIIKALIVKNRKKYLCAFCNSILERKSRFCVVCLPRNLEGKDRTRQMVRLRDNLTCQTCSKKWVIGTRRFDVHHLGGLCGKKSLRYDKTRDMHLLLTLCHKCHFNHPLHTLKSKIKKDCK